MDHDGYIRSESEERIAGGWGAKGMGEDGGDVELGHANGGFDTSVVGGRGRDDEPPVWGMPVGHHGHLHHLHHGAGLDDKDRIMKTVHINQFSEND